MKINTLPRAFLLLTMTAPLLCISVPIWADLRDQYPGTIQKQQRSGYDSQQNSEQAQPHRQPKSAPGRDKSGTRSQQPYKVERHRVQEEEQYRNSKGEPKRKPAGRPDKRRSDHPDYAPRYTPGDRKHPPRTGDHKPRKKPRHKPPGTVHRTPIYTYRRVLTPRYHTRYIAPIRRHYHPIGHRVRVLPRTYIRLVVYGVPYFYYTGIYYRPHTTGYIVVAAPIGAVVKTLPTGYISFSIGLTSYFFVNGTYYLWDEPRAAYVVVEKPAGADEAIASATVGRLFVYPNKGQDEEQQAKDRYECHRWAVTESGIDPTEEDKEYSDKKKQDYKRAISACLEGRDYTVK